MILALFAYAVASLGAMAFALSCCIAAGRADAATAIISGSTNQANQANHEGDHYAAVSQ